MYAYCTSIWIALGTTVQLYSKHYFDWRFTFSTSFSFSFFIVSFKDSIAVRHFQHQLNQYHRHCLRQHYCGGNRNSMYRTQSIPVCSVFCVLKMYDLKSVGFRGPWGQAHFVFVHLPMQYILVSATMHSAWPQFFISIHVSKHSVLLFNIE